MDHLDLNPKHENLAQNLYSTSKILYPSRKFSLLFILEFNQDSLARMITVLNSLIIDSSACSNNECFLFISTKCKLSKIFTSQTCVTQRIISPRSRRFELTITKKSLRKQNDESVLRNHSVSNRRCCR